MDWRDRFRAPATFAARVAPENTDHGVLISDRDGALQAYAWDVPAGTVRALTTGDAATLEAAISTDGRHIYFMVEDEPGTEIGHLHAVPFEGGEPVDMTPDLPSYVLYGVLERDGVVAGAVGLEGVASVLLIDGEETSTYPAEGMPWDLAIDPGSDLIALTETTPGEGMVTRVRAISISTGETIATLPAARAGAIGGGVVAVAYSEGEWERPALWRPGAAPEPISTDVPGDLVPNDLSPEGTKVLLAQHHRASVLPFLFDTASGEMRPVPGPGGAIDVWSSAQLIDDGTVLASWSDAHTPMRPIVSTSEGWEAANAGAVPEFPGAEWEEVTFPSSGGVEIQGWLLRPEGTGPWPTVLYTHGGPTAVALPTFRRIEQAWVDHGYALLSVNYRGSVTFGESFREALTGNIGLVDIDDVVAARSWLVASGIADPDQIVKHGYSYGGYLTLQALGVHPELWACGIAGAPVADWTLGHELSNDLLRAYDLSLFGASPDELPDRYHEASPIAYVDNYTAPLYISQPENDTRTPFEPVKRFVEELDARGKQVELHLMPAGHAGAGTEQEIDMVERWFAFADGVLGERSRAKGS